MATELKYLIDLHADAYGSTPVDPITARRELLTSSGRLAELMGVGLWLQNEGRARLVSLFIALIGVYRAELTREDMASACREFDGFDYGAWGNRRFGFEFALLNLSQIIQVIPSDSDDIIHLALRLGIDKDELIGATIERMTGEWKKDQDSPMASKVTEPHDGMEDSIPVTASNSMQLAKQAGLALQGLCANPELANETPRDLASRAVANAQALVDALGDT